VGLYPTISDPAGELRAHGRARRPLAVRPLSAAAWPPARRLCLEWRMRLPGYGCTGTPVNDDAPIVVKVVWLLSGSVGAGWRVGCC